MSAPPPPAPIPYRITLDAASRLDLIWDVVPGVAEVFDAETGALIAQLYDGDAVSVRVMWVRADRAGVPIYANPAHPPRVLPYTPREPEG